jgi:hypothetical protein
VSTSIKSARKYTDVRTKASKSGIVVGRDAAVYRRREQRGRTARVPYRGRAVTSKRGRKCDADADQLADWKAGCQKCDTAEIFSLWCPSSLRCAHKQGERSIGCGTSAELPSSCEV